MLKEFINNYLIFIRNVDVFYMHGNSIKTLFFKKIGV